MIWNLQCINMYWFLFRIKCPFLLCNISDQYIFFSCSFAEFMHSSVRYIEMSNTHLQSVDDETFQGLRLKTLKLIDNELQDISERSFRWVLPSGKVASHAGKWEMEMVAQNQNLHTCQEREMMTGQLAGLFTWPLFHLGAWECVHACVCRWRVLCIFLQHKPASCKKGVKLSLTKRGRAVASRFQRGTQAENASGKCKLTHAAKAKKKKKNQRKWKTFKRYLFECK